MHKDTKEKFLTSFTDLSLIKTDLNWPFSSKNTSLSPALFFSSETARVLICSVFPFSILTFERNE